MHQGEFTWGWVVRGDAYDRALADQFYEIEDGIMRLLAGNNQPLPFRRTLGGSSPGRDARDFSDMATPRTLFSSPGSPEMRIGVHRTIVLWWDYRFAVIIHLVTPVHHAAGGEVPPSTWWYNLERIHAAFEDLDCRALLSGTG